MDTNRMTVKLQEALQTASAHAMRRSHQGIDVEHLLLALIEQADGLAGPLLEQAGNSVTALTGALANALAKVPQAQGAGARPGQIHTPSRLSQVMTRAEQGVRWLPEVKHRVDD